MKKDEWKIEVDCNKEAFIVATLGCWGRGETLKKAAEKCRESGGRASDLAVAYYIIGDDTPEINESGYFIRDGGSYCKLIGKFRKLSTLWNLAD